MDRQTGRQTEHHTASNVAACWVLVMRNMNSLLFLSQFGLKVDPGSYSRKCATSYRCSRRDVHWRRSLVMLPDWNNSSGGGNRHSLCLITKCTERHACGIIIIIIQGLRVKDHTDPLWMALISLNNKLWLKTRKLILDGFSKSRFSADVNIFRVLPNLCK